MPKVKILSDHVANQIAAGEVVERPASVVKELLENAVDSGATRIKISFGSAGRSFITVEDNGCGMTREDAMTALERHATSKLETSEDLDAVTTFGFRGEALPSIASVSHFTLKTRTEEQVAGTEIRIDGGRYAFCRDCGTGPGTVVCVEGLFYNVPARLKFLRADSTESAHITRIVRLYALAHPKINFMLFADGREIFVSPSCRSPLDRVCMIWGRQLAGDLMVLSEKAIPGIRLSGLLGKPGVSRAGRQEIVTIVNGRPIDSRLMVNSLIESYHTLIPRGRYPLAYLFLQIDPHLIDVNVHPAKREIRFRDESKVRNFVMLAVLSALGLTDDAPEKSVPAGTIEPSREQAPETVEKTAAFVGKTVPETAPARAISEAPVPAAPPVSPAAAPVPANFSVPEFRRQDSQSESLRAQMRAWRYLGQMANGDTAIFQAGENLLLVNLKYARERLAYERVLRLFEEEKCPASQELLMPEILELSPIESDVMRRSVDVFKEAGFEINEFGRDVFRITAVPEWLEENESPKDFARDLLERIRRAPASYSRGNIAAETIAKLACSRAGTRKEMLDAPKTHSLLARLFECSQPNTSPRGFKIFAEISRGEILGKFGARFDK